MTVETTCFLADADGLRDLLPARFLKPWEVLEKDIHDMGARLKAGNKYLLIVVDRASKFLFACLLPSKTVQNVAKKLLELLLRFGIPLSLRSDLGTEFTAKLVQHLCKWLNVTIDYAPSDHPRAQGAVERLGGGSMKPSWNFAKIGFDDGMDIFSQHFGYIERHPIYACQARPTPSFYYSVVTAVPRWTLPHQSPTTKARKDYTTLLLTRAKPFAMRRTSATICNIAMSRNDSDESTRTLEPDARLPEPE